MERVARRFLLHNRRENEDVKESDFDDLKQELNMAKYEILNNSKLIKENLKGYETILQKGLRILNQCFFLKDDFAENSKKFNNYFHSKKVLNLESDDLSDPFDIDTSETIKPKEN